MREIENVGFSIFEEGQMEFEPDLAVAELARERFLLGQYDEHVELFAALFMQEDGTICLQVMEDGAHLYLQRLKAEHAGLPASGIISFTYNKSDETLSLETILAEKQQLLMEQFPESYFAIAKSTLQNKQHYISQEMLQTMAAFLDETLTAEAQESNAQLRKVLCMGAIVKTKDQIFEVIENGNIKSFIDLVEKAQQRGGQVLYCEAKEVVLTNLSLREAHKRFRESLENKIVQPSHSSAAIEGFSEDAKIRLDLYQQLSTVIEMP